MPSEETTDGCNRRRIETAASKESSDYSIPVYANNNGEPRLSSEHTGGNLGCTEEIGVVNSIAVEFPTRSGRSFSSSDEEVKSSGNSSVTSSKPTASASTFADEDATTTSFENQNRVAHKEEAALESSEFSLVKQCRHVMDLGPLVVASTRCNDQVHFCENGGDDSRKAFDRICVSCKNELQLIDISKGKEASGRQATSIVTVEMEGGVTAAAWNAEGSCLAVGDAMGRIHLVLPDGTIMVTQNLGLMGAAAADNQGVISKYNSANLLDISSSSSSSIAVVALEFVYRAAAPSTKCSETVYRSEELVAMTKSGTLLHMGNLCLGGLEKAITANPPDLKALRSLKSSFSAIRVNVSSDPVSFTTYSGTECTSVFIATKGGLSLWQRSRHVPSSPLVLLHERNTVEQQPKEEAFGCGFPTLLQGTSDGSYLLVADSVGGLGCWDTQSNGMRYMYRWRWLDKQDELTQHQCTTIESMALLPEEGNGGNRSLCVACIMGSNCLLIALLSPSPPFKASLLYCNEIHVPWDLLSPPPPAACLGMMVASPSRDSHRVFIVSAAVSRPTEKVESRCIGIELLEGYEILPLHQMRALIADGAFRDALDLVKETNMNYEEAYLTYLAAVVKRGGSGSLENSNSEYNSHLQLSTSLSTIKEILSALKTHEALQRAKEVLCGASKGGLGAMKAYLLLLQARLASLSSHDRAFRETLLPQVDNCLRRLVTYGMLVGDVGSSYTTCGNSNIHTSAVGEKVNPSDRSCTRSSSSVVMKGWNWFRNCELEDALELCLKGGEVLAAVVIWRRHSFIGAAAISPLQERGVARKFEGQDQSEQQHMKSPSSRTYLLLPSLLQKLPTSVPHFPLASWLRDEVIPVLPVEGVIEIRTWAECYVKGMESTDGSPYSATTVARAVIDGSTAVLGAAATARRGLRWEQYWQWRRPCHHYLAEEEEEAPQQANDGEECIHEGEDPCGFGLMEAYWKPDGLDVLTRDLKDLVYAWDHHNLRLSLSEFQTIGREAAVLRVIDRVKDPNLLSDEIQNHALPLARRFGLRGQDCLLRYITSCTKFIAIHRSRKDCPSRSDYRSTELRAVAVIRCMEAEEGDVRVIEEDDHHILQHSKSTTATATDLRVAAVLNLLRSVCFPFSSELLSLAEDALYCKNVTLTLQEELQEATRVLSISQIVFRHDIVGFSMVEPSQASIIVRHIAAKVSCPTALGDALQVARAYSHLSERHVYVDYLQNLLAFRDSAAAETNLVAPSPKESPLDAHCSRVMAILNDLPRCEASSIVQEVLLYALRTLNDLQKSSLVAREGMKLGEIEGSLGGSLFPNRRGLELVCEGSDAEEAMLLTAAACRLAEFLGYSTEEEAQRSRSSSSHLRGHIGHIGSHSLCIAAGRRSRNASYLSASVLLPVLSTLSNLQGEFGIFVPLNLLEKPRTAGIEWESSEEFSSVMSLLFERIKDVYGGLWCANGEGDGAAAGLGIIFGNSHSPPSGNRNDGHKQQSRPQGGGIGKGVDEFIRARRLAELLSVPWSRVMVHCAEEAVHAGCGKGTLRFCRLLTKAQAVNSGSGGSSSLALRDAAVILLKFIALQGKRGGPLSSLSFSDFYHHQHYHLSELEDVTNADVPEMAEGLKLMHVVLESMALSLECIEKSALACDPTELPRMVDLLQGANTLADLLSCSSAGTELDSLLNQSSLHNQTAAKAIGISNSIEGSPAVVPTAHIGDPLSSPLLTSVNGHHGNGEGGGCWGLTWFRAPSLVLPSGLGLRLAGSLMLQEMRVRLEIGGDLKASSNDTTAAAIATTMLPARTFAMMRLLEFLEEHGGLQLSIHVILSMHLQPPEAFSFLQSNLSSMAIKSLSSLKLDMMHILGLLLSIPQKEAQAIYQHAISTTQRDFVRTRELACLGIELGWAWRKNELLTHCLELERSAYWWDVLATLQVPFDHMNFRGGSGRLDEDGDNSLHVTDSYAMSLLRLILKQSGGNMPLTLDFCEHYGVDRSYPLLLFVEHQLLDDNIASYKQDVLSVLSDIKEDEALVKLLQNLLRIRGPPDFSTLTEAKKHNLSSSDGNRSSRVSSTDYDRLYFICSLLAELSQDAEEVKFISHGMEILVLLENTPLSNSLERIPFQSLLFDPRKTLSPFLTPETIIKLIPLCLVLDLHIGECYLKMVQTMYETADKMEGNSSPPSWTSVQPWIKKIHPSELACKALICVSDNVKSDAEQLEVLQLAISKAKEAMSRAEEDVVVNFENVPPPQPRSSNKKEMNHGEGVMMKTTIHPISSGGATTTTKLPVTITTVSSSHEGEGHGGASLAEKLYKELKVRLCALRHRMVLIDCLDHELADSLSPFFMGGAEDFLLELFSRSSLKAAIRAIQEEKCDRKGRGGGSRMDAYRASAGNAYRAACLIAGQRGLDSHDVERVRQKLALHWIFSTCSNERESLLAKGSSCDTTAATRQQPPSSRGGGLCPLLLDNNHQTLAAFSKTGRELSKEADCLAVLRVAFVSSICSSLDGSIDSILSMDLKTKVDSLLSFAREGRHGKATFRSRWRALYAAGIIAPKRTLAHIYYKSSQALTQDSSTATAATSSLKENRVQGIELSMLSNWALHIGYMVDLETLGLGFSLDEIMSCDKANLTRGLLRDHPVTTPPMSDRFMPVLCDMCLDAGVVDAPLWDSLLVRMDREGQHRHLLLSVLPRLSYTATRVGELASTVWSNAMRLPLKQLLNQREALIKARLVCSNSNSYPGGGLASPSTASEEQQLKYKSFSNSNLDQQQSLFHDLELCDIITVLDTVVYCMRRCPCIDIIDVRWHVNAILSLENPLLHQHAISIAASAHLVTERASLLLHLIRDFGICSSAVLNEVRAGREIGRNDKQTVMKPIHLVETSHRGIVNAIFDAVDSLDKHSELIDSDHLEAFVRYLVLHSREEKLVQFCLAHGRHLEAERIAAARSALDDRQKRQSQCT